MRKRNMVRWVFSLLIGISAMWLGSSVCYADDQLVEMISTAQEEYTLSTSQDSTTGLEAYMNETAQNTKVKKTRGSRLSGQERVIYDYVMERIDAVARGEESSAEIRIPLSALGIAGRYSAEDLELTTIFNEEKSAVSESARQAVNSKFTVDLYSILYAILGDCPYRLYWYDKTSGIAFSAPEIGAYRNGSKEYILFPKDAVVKFSMSVSQEYGDGYTVDTGKTISATEAAGYAGSIVAENAALSDLEKLTAYRDVILELTDYNYDAVYDYEENAIYGNPWQLIYVFDQDPATKVVCEGYSKAFQYLCNLSDFSSDVTCLSVGGYMQSNTGSGDHMWNVVQIDGENYLVDLTNLDGDEAPTDGTLFLDGVTGNYDEGYIFQWSEEDYIGYAYDAAVLRYYDEGELTLANHAYGKAPREEEVLSEGESPENEEKAEENTETLNSVNENLSDTAKSQVTKKTTVKKTLSAPKVKVKHTKKKVKVQWEKVKGARKYKVYYRTKKNGKYKLYKTTKKRTCVIPRKGHKKYYIKVKAAV